MLQFNTALYFLINTFFDLYLAAILIRVILQYVRAPFGNPVAQFIVRITDPGVKIFRKFVPGFFGLDCASLLFAFLLGVFKLFTINLLVYHMLPHPGFIVGCLIYSLFTLITITLSIYFWSIIMMVVFSLLAQGYQLNSNPIYHMVYLIAEPVLRPIRRVIPPIGGFDLSPLFACIIISVLKIFFNIF